MKYTLLTLLFFSHSFYSYSQQFMDGLKNLDKDKLEIPDSAECKWKKGGISSLNFGQVHLSNWAAGGESQMSVLALSNLFANFKCKKFTWDNNFDFAFGMLKTGNNPFQKSEDRIELNSKLGRKFAPNWFYAGVVNLRTQITPTFNNGRFISGAFAPAWALAAFGINFRKDELLTIFMSPSTGRFTIVLDENLANAGEFGVRAAEVDDNGVILTPGQKVRPEFGAYVAIRLRKEIMKNVTYSTKLELFNNYTDPNIPNRKNIDVNWENLIGMKVNKFISTTLFTHLIYDDDIRIPVEFDADNNPTRFGPRTQFKQTFGIGLSYKFDK